jgi:hypothetical protein
MIVLFVLISGCHYSMTDSDGDHLPDSEEEAWGTDPMKPDTDSDGIDDMIEISWTLTNPIAADTDQDSMNDGDELLYGLDPTDEESHPYTLGWPMATRARKDGLDIGIPPHSPIFGGRIPRFSIFDELEEQYDIYDMSGSGVPVIISMLSLVSLPVERTQVLMWLEGEIPGPARPSNPSQWVRDLAEEGAVNLALVTMSPVGLTPDVGPPSTLDLSDICNFKKPNFGCFADSTQNIYRYSGEPVLDSWILMDENMVVRSFVKDSRTTAPPEGMKDFEEFERTLATMLDYTPPTYP